MEAKFEAFKAQVRGDVILRVAKLTMNQEKYIMG